MTPGKLLCHVTVTPFHQKKLKEGQKMLKEGKAKEG